MTEPHNPSKQQTSAKAVKDIGNAVTMSKPSVESDPVPLHQVDPQLPGSAEEPLALEYSGVPLTPDDTNRANTKVMQVVVPPGDAHASTSAGMTSEPDENAAPSEEQKSSPQLPKYLKLSYYQQFFNVDTKQVMQRILWSMVPKPQGETYVELHIQPNPDLYGPFWIAATLACTIAMASSIVSFVYSGGKAYPQKYDYNKASVAATVTYMYTFLVPSIVWCIVRYEGESLRYSLFDIICLYGYSLAIYVPVSILWMLQPTWLQWVLVFIAAVVSGCVMLFSFKKVFSDVGKKVSFILILIIGTLHIMVAIGFAAYFFQPTFTGEIPTVLRSVTSGLTNGSLLSE